METYETIESTKFSHGNTSIPKSNFFKASIESQSKSRRHLKETQWKALGRKYVLEESTVSFMHAALEKPQKRAELYCLRKIRHALNREPSFLLSTKLRWKQFENI